MNTARRVTAIFFSVVTSLVALWAAAGWVNILVNGASWSNTIAMSGFSVVIIVLALICAALWGSYSRAMTIAALVLAGLSTISLIASIV